MKHAAISPGDVCCARNLPVKMRVRHPRRQVLYVEDEPIGALRRIDEGYVLLTQVLPDGRRHIVDIAGPGDLLGHETMNGRHCHTAEAATALVTAVIDSDAADHDEFEAALLYALRRSCMRARNQIKRLALRRAIERIAAFILLHFDHENPEYCPCPLMLQHKGEVRDLVLTRQEIADYLGLTPETVSRSFSKLSSQGTIDCRTAREVSLTSPCALCQLAGMADHASIRTDDAAGRECHVPSRGPDSAGTAPGSRRDAHSRPGGPALSAARA